MYIWSRSNIFILAFEKEATFWIKGNKDEKDEEEQDEDDFPTICLICEKEFTNPVVTK